MFAARIRHPLVPEALGRNRAGFDAALEAWSDFLAAQPGLVSFTVLVEPDGGLLALSLWREATDFQAAFARPDLAAASSGLMAFFAAPTAPEFPAVLHHRAPT
jgi:hypothetical protein